MYSHCSLIRYIYIHVTNVQSLLTNPLYIYIHVTNVQSLLTNPIYIYIHVTNVQSLLTNPHTLRIPEGIVRSTESTGLLN